jgi:hypothetical protein
MIPALKYLSAIYYGPSPTRVGSLLERVLRALDGNDPGRIFPSRAFLAILILKLGMVVVFLPRHPSRLGLAGVVNLLSCAFLAMSILN